MLIQWVFSFFPSFPFLCLSLALSVTLRTVECCVCITMYRTDIEFSIANCISNEYHTMLALGFAWARKRMYVCVCVRARVSGMRKEKTRSSCSGLMKQVSLKSATGLNLQRYNCVLWILVSQSACACARNFISQSAIFLTQDFTTDRFLIAIRGSKCVNQNFERKNSK